MLGHLALGLGALVVVAVAHAHTDALAQPLVASSCSGACDHQASDCIDGCEEKFKDDKPRLQCKLACVAVREKCDSACH